MDSNSRSPCRVQHFSRPPRTPRRQTGSTIGKRRFTVCRARLAPAMISTRGRRASRRRQRGALSAWSLFGSSRPMPGDAVSCRSSIYVTSQDRLDQLRAQEGEANETANVAPGLGWCEDRGLTLTAIRPHDVATYIEELQA